MSALVSSVSVLRCLLSVIFYFGWFVLSAHCWGSCYCFPLRLRSQIIPEELTWVGGSRGTVRFDVHQLLTELSKQKFFQKSTATKKPPIQVAFLIVSTLGSACRTSHNNNGRNIANVKQTQFGRQSISTYFFRSPTACTVILADIYLWAADFRSVHWLVASSIPCCPTAIDPAI